MIGIVSYIVVFLFTFFVGSFIAARHCHEDPTEPSTFLLLVGGIVGVANYYPIGRDNPIASWHSAVSRQTIRMCEMISAVISFTCAWSLFSFGSGLEKFVKDDAK